MVHFRSRDDSSIRFHECGTGALRPEIVMCAQMLLSLVPLGWHGEAHVLALKKPSS
jgi:hypothetical protein